MDKELAEKICNGISTMDELFQLAARWLTVRNIPEDKIGKVNVPIVAVPRDEAGQLDIALTGEDADKYVDAYAKILQS